MTRLGRKRRWEHWLFSSLAYRRAFLIEARLRLPIDDTAVPAGPVFMEEELLTVAVAARRLGITATTLYDWLGKSDHGLLVIRGRRVTIDYMQGGPRGQGRIRIEADEIERLKDLMRVVPRVLVVRKISPARRTFPGITVPLGRPDRHP